VNLKPPQVIQSIKRLGFNLVSKKTCGLDLEPDDVGQKGQNYSTYDNTHENSKTQSQKMFFFIADSETCQVFWGFEQFSSAIGGETVLQSHVETAVPGWKHRQLGF